MTINYNFILQKQLFIFLMGLLTLQIAHSQCLVENIVAKYSGVNLGSGASSEDQLLVGDYLYFSATDGIHGYELWMHNFKTSETSLIDIYSEEGSSSPSNFLVAKDRVYFQAQDKRGILLYSVPVGTLDTASVYFNPTYTGDFRFEPFLYEDEIFFKAESKELGEELYIMQAGTMDYEIMDIYEGTEGSYPEQFLATNGKLYFKARNFADYGAGIVNEELQILDLETKELSTLEITSGNEGSDPEIYLVANNKVYFSTDYGRKLYMLTAGTSTDTAAIEGFDINGGIENGNFHVAGDAIFFSASSESRGTELWTIPTGTLDTTMIDINPGNGDSYPSNFYSANNKLYFSASNDHIGEELWVLPIGTMDTLSINLNEGGTSTYAEGSLPKDFVEADGFVYFTAVGSNYDRKVFSISTETNDTASIDFTPFYATEEISFAKILGDQLYFVVSAPNESPFIGTIKTGTANDTASIRLDVKPHGTRLNTSNIGLISAYQDQLLFVQDNKIFGKELYSYNQTTAITNIIKDINVLTPYTRIDNLIKIGNIVYFTAINGVNGQELYMMDLATEEISFVDINAGEGDANPQNITLIDDYLYFTAEDGKRGRELWKVNVGTLDTASIDINKGPNDSSIESFTEAGGKIYFAANDGKQGQELYMVTKGMLDTASVDIYKSNSAFGSYPSNFKELGGKLYFSAAIGEQPNGFDIRILCAVSVGSLNVEREETLTSITDLTIAGNYIYFSNEVNNEKTLWYVEGGTMNITQTDVSPGPLFPTGFYGTYTGGRLYFLLRTEEEGREIHYTIPGSTAVIPVIVNSGGGHASYGLGSARVFSTNNDFYFEAMDENGNGLFVIKEGETTAEKLLEGSTIKFIQGVDGKLYLHTNTGGFNNGIYESAFSTIDLETYQIDTLHIFTKRINTSWFLGDVFYAGLAASGIKGGGHLVSFNIKTNEIKNYDINNGVAPIAPDNLFRHNETVYLTADQYLLGRGLIYKLIPFEAGIGSEMTVNSTDQVNLFDLVTGEEAGGTWQRTSGTGGTFDAMAGTMAINTSFTTSDFLYIGNCYPDTAFVKLINAPCPTINAGVDTAICNSSYTLQGTTLQTGETGQWTFVNNPNDKGTLTNANSPNAVVNANFDAEEIFETSLTRTFTLQWKATSTSCPEGVSDTVIVTLNPPVNAGADRLSVCGTSIQLGAAPASGGTGNWSFVMNPNTTGNITNLSNPNATLTGIIGGNYELEWMVTGGVCNGSMDRVNITFQSDSDNDTFQDCVDLCEGGDDRINSDNTGMPDACDCAPNSAEGEFVMVASSDLDANAGQNPSEMIADFEITSDAIVKATPTHPTTIFQAGNKILLQPGFHAQAGSDFTAKIAPCTLPAPLVEDGQSISYRSKNIANTPSVVFDLRVQPNLIHSEATIFLDLSTGQALKLLLYDQTGRLVRTFLNTTQPAGSHQFLLRTDYLKSGMYYLQMLGKEDVVVKRMVVQQ